MLLAGRLRDSTEDQVILEVIEKHMKRRVDINVLFGYDGGSGSLASSDALQAIYSCMDPDFVHLVWTPEMLRMAVLVYRALQFNEPVLLVGNTGFVRSYEKKCVYTFVLSHSQVWQDNPMSASYVVLFKETSLCKLPHAYRSK